MKNLLLHELLKLYKPVDAKLRAFEPYRKLSRHLQARYNFARQSGKHGIREKAQRYYVENYELLPITRGQVFFDSFWGQSVGCNPYAIYLDMLMDPDLRNFTFVWCRNKNVDVPKVALNNDRTRFVEYNTIDFSAALLQSEFLISNSNFPPYFTVRDGQFYFPTWHGVPIKTLGYAADPRLQSSANTQKNFYSATRILLPSESCKSRVVEAYGTVLDHVEIDVIGAPRVDLTLKSDKAKVRARLGLSDARPIILYAPTWRGNLQDVQSSIDIQLGAISHLQNQFGESHHIFVSLHHLTRKAASDLPASVLHVPEDVNINEILAVTDILISDYSSIVVDFLPLDRPTILYVPDLAEYADKRGLYLDLKAIPARIVEGLEALKDAVEAGTKPSSFECYASAKAELFQHEDGAAAKRAVSVIKKYADQKRPRKELTGAIKAASQKKSLLINAGGLLPNGITSSLRNLINTLDQDKFEVFLILDAKTVDADVSRLEQLAQVRDRCKLILRTGQIAVESQYVKIHTRFMRGEPVNDEEIAVLKRVFSREFRRITGGMTFDVAIDFSGYSPYWAGVIGCADADTKICYQHSDLWAEFNNTHASRNQTQLHSVFRAYKWFDRIVAVSDEVRISNQQQLQDFYPEAEARTVHNALDVQRIRTAAQVPISMISTEAALILSDPRNFNFIAVGRLSPEKRYDRLLKAFAQISKKYPHTALIICGRGPLEQDLKEMASELGIGQSVCFLGQVLNPYPLMAAADACVLSSDYEGQGMVLLESLLLNTACIGTDSSGIRSVLSDGRGYLAAPTVKAFVEAMDLAVQGKIPPGDGSFGEAYAAKSMQEFISIL